MKPDSEALNFIKTLINLYDDPRAPKDLELNYLTTLVLRANVCGFTRIYWKKDAKRHGATAEALATVLRNLMVAKEIEVSRCLTHAFIPRVMQFTRPDIVKIRDELVRQTEDPARWDGLPIVSELISESNREDWVGIYQLRGEKFAPSDLSRNIELEYRRKFGAKDPRQKPVDDTERLAAQTEPVGNWREKMKTPDRSGLAPMPDVNLNKPWPLLSEEVRVQVWRALRSYKPTYQ